MFNFLLADYLADKVEPYILWVTLSVIAALLIVGLIIYFAKKDIFKKYLKIALISFLIYSLVLGAGYLILEIIKHYDASYLDENYVNKDIIGYVFIPCLITIVLALVSAVALIVLNKKSYGNVKTVSVVLGAIIGAVLIVTLILITVYFTKHIDGSSYWEEYGKLNSPVLYISALLLVILSIVAVFLIDRKDKSGFDTRCIAFAGICVALSFALSYVKLFSMPQGGSITLASMFPIMLFSYVYGCKKGLLVGCLYGMLQALQDPFIVHSAQFLLDYPIAFAMTGFAGAFRKLKFAPAVNFAFGAVLAGALRFISHVLSGTFAFGAYALDSGSASLLGYSAAYNSYVFIDVVIVVVIGVICLLSKALQKELFKATANNGATTIEDTEATD